MVPMIPLVIGLSYHSSRHPVPYSYLGINSLWTTCYWISQDRYCYSRVLELLVNVWAYHSARRMIYVNPETGAMQEHHKLKSRRGHMWVKWFSFATLKSMDEDLAEESDSDHPRRRWLWPSTGEVFWQGISERERNMRHQHKERRKQQSKDKIQRIRKRARQKTLGKYIKPPPEATGALNATRTHWSLFAWLTNSYFTNFFFFPVFVFSFSFYPRLKDAHMWFSFVFFFSF